MKKLRFNGCLMLLCLVFTSVYPTMADAPPASGQTQYKIIDLGPLPGIPAKNPVGLSGKVVTDREQVLGNFIFIDNRGNLRFGSFLWSNGHFTGLAKLPANFDLNIKGQVVGFTNDAKLPNLAVVWQDGKLCFLKGFPGKNADARGIDGGSKAVSINNRSQIVGWSMLKGNTHAVSWSNATMQDLGVLPGCADSSATAINDNGQIVGMSGQKQDRFEYACLWQNGKIQSLGSMAEARAINNQGQVAGERMPDGSHDTSKSLRKKACVWQNGKLIGLANLPNCDYADAYSINDRDQIVGEAETVPGPWHACLWQNGKLIDLNDSVPIRGKLLLRKAVSINNKGEILCEAKDTERDYLLLLCPVGKK